MKKGHLIGGIICLAAALLIAVLAVAAPPGVTLSFMVEGTNMPFIPAIGLGILGVWLLVTGRRSEEEEAAKTTAAEQEDVELSEKAILNKRLETIGWGLFLVMLGGFTLVPQELVAKGLWSIGVGVIMLGLNVTRYFYKIKMSGFTTFLGVISLLSGVTQLMGMHELDAAILLIILGAYLIVKPWFDKRQLFGKAEDS
jgi:ABC-type nickel/cobalt efflux system permease component RcnA